MSSKIVGDLFRNLH